MIPVYHIGIIITAVTRMLMEKVASISLTVRLYLDLYSWMLWLSLIHI